jgi:GH25 family lysozyme M1 (1,4-beta-N-acetylmuramidase)
MTLFNEDQVRNRLATPAGLLGIDVYHGDGTIKWSALKGTNRFYAWIKATEGGDWQDPSFADNRNGAHEAGVINGAYHFFRPKTSVQAQIDNFCGMVGAMRTGELPPSLDLEVPKDWKARPELVEQHKAEWQSLTMENRMKIVLQWLEAVEKRLGIRPIIYAGKNFVDEILGNDPRLAKYLLWLPRYEVDAPEVPEPWTRYNWWQYSEHGHLPDVTSHELDFNVFAGTLDDLKALCFGAQARTDETDETAQPWYERCPFVRWIRRLFGFSN